MLAGGVLEGGWLARGRVRKVGRGLAGGGGGVLREGWRGAGWLTGLAGGGARVEVGVGWSGGGRLAGGGLEGVEGAWLKGLERGFVEPGGGGRVGFGWREGWRGAWLEGASA